MKRLALVVLVLPVVVLFAVFVWPTRYRYSPGVTTKPRILLVRVDRFTGAAAKLTERGWYSCRNWNYWENAEQAEPAWSFALSDSLLANYVFSKVIGLSDPKEVLAHRDSTAADSADSP